MISEIIEKTIQTLQERGIPENSFFSVIFEDGSEVTEKDTNWSTFSEKKEVDYFSNKKVVKVSKYPVKLLKCFHEGIEASIEVPKDCQAYQAIRSETLIIQGAERKNRIIGRVIGIVKGDEVIEELFLNGIQFKVEGFKK